LPSVLWLETDVAQYWGLIAEGFFC